MRFFLIFLILAILLALFVPLLGAIETEQDTSPAVTRICPGTDCYEGLVPSESFDLGDRHSEDFALQPIYTNTVLVHDGQAVLGAGICPRPP